MKSVIGDDYLNFSPGAARTIAATLLAAADFADGKT